MLRIQILAWKQNTMILSPYTGKKTSVTYPIHSTHELLPTILRAGLHSPISAEDTGQRPEASREHGRSELDRQVTHWLGCEG